MIQFVCLVKNYFPFSLNTLFKPFSFGYRGTLSLDGFFIIFVALEKKKASHKLLFSAFNYIIIIIRFTC